MNVDRVVTASRVVLLLGVLMCVLAAFGVKVGDVNLFELGVAVSFGSFLVP